MAETTQPASDGGGEYSENQIAVHWREEEYVLPPEEFKAQANANDESILERFSPEHFPECFEEYAELLTWDKKWDTLLDTSNPPFFKWWVGRSPERAASTASTGTWNHAGIRTRSSGYRARGR